MERMKDLTQQYIEQLENMVKDLREKKFKLEEENKKLKEKLSEITMVADDEKQSVEHMLELEEENRELKLENAKLKDRIITDENFEDKLAEENKKLREDNRFLTKISKEYMEKENIVQVTEFTELYKNDLEKENKNLREKLEQIKEAYIKFEKSQSKREKEFNNAYGDLDQLIMNR